MARSFLLFLQQASFLGRTPSMQNYLIWLVFEGYKSTAAAEFSDSCRSPILLSSYELGASVKS